MSPLLSADGSTLPRCLWAQSEGDHQRRPPGQAQRLLMVAEEDWPWHPRGAPARLPDAEALLCPQV